METHSDARRPPAPTRQAWRRAFIPDSPQRAGKYQLFGNQYHDQLLRDAGANPFRRLLPTLGLAELVWPTAAGDYRPLVSAWWPEQPEGAQQQRGAGGVKQAAAAARR